MKASVIKIGQRGRVVPIKEGRSKRAPIQIAATVSSEGDEILLALCDDGTIWHFANVTGWIKFPAIPGDDR